MKATKNHVGGVGGISSEARLCFGAAAGCFVIGIAGFAINALSGAETPLSTFLVISGFYLLLGIISLFKREEEQGANEELAEEPMESAA